MSSSPPESVYFINGSLHGKTLPIGWGIQLLQHGSELYRRQGTSRVFYLSESSCPALGNVAKSTEKANDASESDKTTTTPTTPTTEIPWTAKQ